MRIWITRAEPEASATAERLRALGHEPVADPVLEIQPASEPPDLTGVAALVFTSRNGVRAFAALSPERGLRVFTVGDATAEAAREAGFAEAASASGDVVALADLIAASRHSLEGEVLYLAPEAPAGDLMGALAGRGVEARVQVVYRTLPTELTAAPADVDAVLIHSARAARRLVQASGLESIAPNMTAICISAAAAEPLGEVSFREVLIAPAPNEGAMLETLEVWAARQAPPKLFPPAFWIAMAFCLACIIGAILVADLGPRLFRPQAPHPAAATAQPLQFRGKSG